MRRFIDKITVPFVNESDDWPVWVHLLYIHENPIDFYPDPYNRGIAEQRLNRITFVNSHPIH